MLPHAFVDINFLETKYIDTIKFVQFCFQFLFSFISFQNILAGAIFGPWVGLPLVCVLTATGATCSFIVSKMFGHAIVEACLKDRIAPIKKMVGHRNVYVQLNLARCIFITLIQSVMAKGL